MRTKLTSLAVVAVFLGMLTTPQRSVACPNNCTLLHMICAEPPCDGFETLYLLLECNGQMEMCPVGCCG